jgi:HEPN domain
MKNVKLTLSSEETIRFSGFNQIAMRLHSIASDDYIACRCCIINGLLSQGFILAEQALEKELKSILLLLNPKENIKLFGSHKIEPIIQRIQGLQDLGLTRFQKYGKRLSDIYELSRYPDNKLKDKIDNWSISGHELEHIDEFFFYINERSPLPDEIKFRSGIYALVCDKNLNRHPGYHWAMIDNLAYIKREQYLVIRYNDATKHLYNAQV